MRAECMFVSTKQLYYSTDSDENFNLFSEISGKFIE